MALRREVVDFIRPHLLHDPYQAAGIGHVSIVENEIAIAYVRVLVKMIYAIGIEQRGAALDPVYLVALGKQELGEVRAILAGNAGDECDFTHSALTGTSVYSCGSLKSVFGDDHDPSSAQRKIEAEMVPTNAAILSDLQLPGKKTPGTTTHHNLP